MKLPPHRKQYCQGVHIYGIEETCTEEVEPGSIFPLCKVHRVRIQTLPRKRTCAGAVIMDEVMRPVHIACNEATGHEEERLCAGCRVKEKQSKEREHRELREPCPTCGHLVPRGTLRTPPSGSRPATGGPTYPPKSSRPKPRPTEPTPMRDSITTDLLPSSVSLWSLPPYVPEK